MNHQSTEVVDIDSMLWVKAHIFKNSLTVKKYPLSSTALQEGSCNLVTFLLCHVSVLWNCFSMVFPSCKQKCYNLCT